MSIHFGKPETFLDFSIALTIIGLSVAFDTAAWSDRLAIGTIAVLAIAMPLALHKAWKNPGRPICLVLLLPAKCRRWMTGGCDLRSKDALMRYSMTSIATKPG